jgi:hypothetical protein
MFVKHNGTAGQRVPGSSARQVESTIVGVRPGRFWIDVRGGERKRRTIALGLCVTQWVVRLRLREYIERAGVSSKHTFHQIQFLVLHFGSRPNGGWSHSLRLDGGR